MEDTQTLKPYPLPLHICPLLRSHLSPSGWPVTVVVTEKHSCIQTELMTARTRAMLLTHILKVPGSSGGPDTGCTDGGYSLLSSVPPGKFLSSTVNPRYN